MCFVSFKIPDLRTSSTGVRTSEKFRQLAPQDEWVQKQISSPVTGTKHNAYMYLEEASILCVHPSGCTTNIYYTFSES